MELAGKPLSRGARAAHALLQTELSVMQRHQTALAKLACVSLEHDLKIHLGCGPQVKSGWLNVDLFAAEAEFSLDIREDWPFPAGSAAIVYSEHVFEHLDHPTETSHYLREAMRVLQPGGVLSIGVPDTEWPVRAYSDPDDSYWRIARERWHPSDCRTRVEHLNYHFRQGSEHKYAWDRETLQMFIEDASFVDVRHRAFDPTLDCADRALGTIYLEARRPA